jgi:hypothetical protein
MERGLFWSVLLIIFVWLTWNGWNEYKKIEAYEKWARDFDQAKYDIYAVLGQKGKQLTWGKPTRQGPINLETFSLENAISIHLLVNDRPVNLENLPDKGNPTLAFTLSEKVIQVPFTQIDLAVKWLKYLEKLL